MAGPDRIKLALTAMITVAGACYHGADRSGDPGGLGDTGGDATDSAEGDEDAGTAADEGGDDGDPGDASCDALEITPSPLRRLTSAQLRFTLEDLLGTSVASEERLGDLQMLVDGDAGGFAATTLAPSAEDVRTYLSLAEVLSSAFVSEPEPAGCAVVDRACVESFVASFGRRAYRRDLAAEEVDDLLTLYDATGTEFGPTVGLQTVVMAILTSPNFLYLEEPADPELSDDDIVPLDGYAVASRLSFFLWSSGPDEELLDAAASGGLAGAGGVEEQARRLMDDPKFARTIRSFHRQWLPVEELTLTQRDDPEWTPQLRDAMEEETLRFAEEAYLGDGDLRGLIAGRFSFVDDALAEFYGVESPAEAFSRVDLAGLPRAGILTQGSFLASKGELDLEVHRGLFVREHLLCDDVAPLPFDDIPEPNAQSRLDDPTCAACHVAMDPIGNGFAGFDSMGRYRTELPDGTPVDQRGSLDQYGVELEDDLVGSFEGPVELADRLAQSDAVARCVGVHWARYATGRRDTDADECAFDAFADQVIETDGDLRELLVAIATSRWFRSRQRNELGG